MRFPNPFPGKPSRLSISGLFLIDPTVLTKLDGLPFRSILEERLGAALFKRLDRANKEQAGSPQLVDALLNAIPDNGSPFFATLRAAHAGDAEAVAAVEAVGVWESFCAGFEGPLDYRQRYRVAIERACREPTEALRRGELDVAVGRLLAEPVTSPLLWRQAIEALDGKTSIEHLGPFQFAVAMEVELSCLAALDAQRLVDDGNENSTLSMLLPDEGSALNPAATFFRLIMRGVGIASLSEMERELQRIGCPVHLGTLKNWNRGLRLPSASSLKLIAKLKPDLARGDALWMLYWATKVLMLLGYYGTQCAARASAEPRPEIRARFRPWPEFPHEHADFGGWCRARYPTWLAYHRARIKTTFP
ncbi:hypothetical protein [Burkholderia gladioli]|uniref:hypothetical protein n=1 Tax=Burkholderia gladioli TaxID=28095 RepID=UPI00163F09FC|nr:hypothetical protein [Burkholderia gladioli]